MKAMSILCASNDGQTEGFNVSSNTYNEDDWE